MITKFFGTAIASSLILSNLHTENVNSIYNDNDYYNTEAMSSIIKENNIIFYGENYDKINDKFRLNLLLDNIRSIDKTDQIFLGLEMVNSDKQIILDKFNQHKINSDKLMELLDWNNNWSYQPEGYELVFNYARKNNIDLLAINEDISYNNIINFINNEKSKSKLVFNQAHFNNFLKNSMKYERSKNIDIINQNYQINILKEINMATNINNNLKKYPDSKLIAYTSVFHSNKNGIRSILDTLFYDSKYNCIVLTPVRNLS